MKLKYLFFACILITGLSGCEKDVITGEGQVIAESRTATGFTGVDMGGASKIYISYGSTFSVEVKGYANLIPLYETKVRNGKLILGFKNNYNIHNDNTEVYITMPSLSSLHMSGSGNADIRGDFPHSASLSLRISGSSDIEMEAGSTDRLDVEISGSGDIDVASVSAKDAEISISGSGEVNAKIIESLDASISGSGSVYYYGSPAVKSRISGSGKVVKRD